MNSIYTNSEHFRNETQTQIKFLGNFPLNKYRKGIAERHGFKSIKSFEDDLDLVTIWIVAYETLGKSGGFDWFYKKEDATECFSKETKYAIIHRTQIALFPFKIKKDIEHDDVCEALEINDYTGQMDKSDISYPFPKSVWKDAIEKYNFTNEIPIILAEDQYKILSDLEETSNTYHKNLKMHQANKDDTEVFDNYIDSKSDFHHYKTLAEKTGIKKSVIDNIIKISYQY